MGAVAAGAVLTALLLVIVAGMGLGILFFVPTLALDFAFRNQFLASLPLRESLRQSGIDL